MRAAAVCVLSVLSCCARDGGGTTCVLAQRLYWCWYRCCWCGLVGCECSRSKRDSLRPALYLRGSINALYLRGSINALYLRGSINALYLRGSINALYLRGFIVAAGCCAAGVVVLSWCCAAVCSCGWSSWRSNQCSKRRTQLSGDTSRAQYSREPPTLSQ